MDKEIEEILNMVKAYISHFDSIFSISGSLRSIESAPDSVIALLDLPNTYGIRNIAVDSGDTIGKETGYSMELDYSLE